MLCIYCALISMVYLPHLLYREISALCIFKEQLCRKRSCLTDVVLIVVNNLEIIPRILLIYEAEFTEIALTTRVLGRFRTRQRCFSVTAR